MSPVADDRVARIKRGIKAASVLQQTATRQAALADLRAWQEIAERHAPTTPNAWGHQSCTGPCSGGHGEWPCGDAKAADAAINRLDVLWGTDDKAAPARSMVALPWVGKCRGD